MVDFFPYIVMCLTLNSFVIVAFAQVDWHDFVVVETVDFKDNESGWHVYFVAHLMHIRDADD